MTIKYKNTLFIIIIFLFQLVQVSAQNAIQEKINQKSLAIEQTDMYMPLEAVSNLDDNAPVIPQAVLSRKQFFQISNSSAKTIQNKHSKYLQMRIPIEGQDIDIQLVEAKIFTDDFHVVAASNPDVELNIDKGLHYWGIVKGAEKSLVTISFFNDEIVGLINVNDNQYVLGKIQDSDYHILYKSSDLNHTPDFSCDALPVVGGENTIISEEAVEKAGAARCIRIHIEADYSLYQQKGGITGTSNYVNGVFAEVASLFANENMNVRMSYLAIWDTPSPYAGNSGDILTTLFNQGRGSTHGDFVHLLHTMGGGGRAYLNSFCSSSYNIGVSGINGSFSSVPTYSWDLYVITHELGHNFGSPHTHACAWNGNNTAIDICGPTFDSGLSNGCSGPIPQNGGTIMSYCHLLNGVGINFNLGFGSQPGNLIRSRYNSASCLQQCDEDEDEDDNNTLLIPGQIQAENYSSQNGIQTENTSDIGGGQNVGWTDQWDYMDYQVNVAQAGCYNVQFRVAAPNNDIKFNIIRNGDFLVNITSAPTGGWQTWKTVTKQINLPAGNQTLRILALNGGWNINWMKFELCNSTLSIPGKIEAEDYTIQSGIQTEPTTDAGGGQNAGWIDQWDYMDYQVNVAQAGCYDVHFRVAAKNNNIKFNLIKDGTFIAGINTPPTGGWQTWKTITKQVNLQAGNQTLQLLATGDAWNINWMKFELCNSGLSIPGKIEAEDYTEQNGIQTGSTTDVGGGQNVGWIDRWDYMNYDVNVEQAGCYNVQFRVAAKNNNIKFNLIKDGTFIAGINTPPTGSWHTWKTITKQVNLQAGNQTLQILATGDTWNINWMKFELCNNSLIVPDDFVQGFSAEIYPNPMDKQDQLFVDVTMPESGNIELSVFDIQGKQIYANTYKDLQQGSYTITLDDNTIFNAQGIYILKVSNDTEQKVFKLIR